MEKFKTSLNCNAELFCLDVLEMIYKEIKTSNVDLTRKVSTLEQQVTELQKESSGASATSSMKPNRRIRVC